MLTEKQRGGIISARKLGHSYRAIATALGCHQKTVGRVLAQHANPEETPPKKSLGRPPLIDTKGCERLKTLVTDGRRQFTAKALRNTWEEKEGKSVCVKTIRRTLHKIGLHSRIAARKPFIKEANRVKRLAWCRERQGWRLLDWKKVFFTDEKSFTQFQKAALTRVWRKPGEEMQLDCLAPRVARSESCMVWAGFAWRQRGPLILHSGSVTGAVHAELLTEHAIPALKAMFPRKNGIFQQDNAPVHTAKVAQAVLAEAKVRALPWPANSPDLNPIENLWSVMQENLRKRTPPPSNLTELKRMVQEEWVALPESLLHNLVESMPRRVNAVIEANGGPTPY